MVPKGLWWSLIRPYYNQRQTSSSFDNLASGQYSNNLMFKGLIVCDRIKDFSFKTELVRNLGAQLKCPSDLSDSLFGLIKGRIVLLLILIRLPSTSHPTKYHINNYLKASNH